MKKLLILFCLLTSNAAMAQATVTVYDADLQSGSVRDACIISIINGEEDDFRASYPVRVLTGNPDAQDVTDLQNGVIRVVRFPSANNTFTSACNSVTACGTAVDLVGTTMSLPLTDGTARLDLPFCKGSIGGFKVRVKCGG